MGSVIEESVIKFNYKAPNSINNKIILVFKQRTYKLKSVFVINMNGRYFASIGVLLWNGAGLQDLHTINHGSTIDKGFREFLIHTYKHDCTT
jgi:hypothetical protein